METVIDYEKNDPCFGCKFAVKKPNEHLVNSWDRRFYCTNKHRINDRLAQVSQKYRAFCIVVENSDKYPLDRLMEIRRELDELWDMMREWNWEALSATENIACSYKEEDSH